MTRTVTLRYITARRDGRHGKETTRMTDMDAACLVKELAEYDKAGLLRTPQGPGPDTIFQCALGHAIRALEERAGMTGAEYVRNPNGSWSVTTGHTTG